MQGWELWLVPVIALGVWVLNTLIRAGRQDDSRNTPSRTSTSRSASTNRPGRPMSDLDRFLEEARRRRQAAQDRPARPPQSVPEALPVAEELRDRPRPVQRAPTPQPQRRKTPRPPAAPPVARRAPFKPAVAEVIPVAVVVEPSPSAGPAVVQVVTPVSTVTPVTRVTPTPARPTSSAGAAVVAIRPSEVSPVLAQVVALLRTPQSVRAAILMNEILGPPKSRRRS
jgi:hypothetical protein